MLHLRISACLSRILVATALYGAFAVAGVTEARAQNEIAGDSVYQLPIKLTDQNNRSFTLQELRGKPVIVSMFYNSCKFVCPMLIDTIREIVQSVKAEDQGKVKVLLVTFDPIHDDLATLKHISQQRGLDSDTWTIARSDAGSVRKLAAALGIQYRRLPNGDYNHTTLLTLLDGEGRIAAFTSQIGGVDKDFAEKLDALVSAVPTVQSEGK